MLIVANKADLEMQRVVSKLSFLISGCFQFKFLNYQTNILFTGDTRGSAKSFATITHTSHRMQCKTANEC